MRGLVAAGSLFAGPMRAYFAPVDRVDGVAMPFDPAVMGRFALDDPPAGWLSAGVVTEFARSAGAVTAVMSGAPATVKTQVRSANEETLSFTFAGWTRLAMVLSAGVASMNLLRVAAGANANASGGVAAAAEPLLTGSTATVLQMNTGTAVQVGDVVVVDEDYAGAAGYVGGFAAGAYVAAGAAVMPDVDYLRRVSFNLGRVVAVSGGAITLASPLPAGEPTAAMKVAVVEGFADRNGGAFLPEWSALFVVDGVQGDRMLLHYPRLQPVGDAAAEKRSELAAGVERWRPYGTFRALPVVDANDGAASVSFRSYLPAPMRAV